MSNERDTKFSGFASRLMYDIGVDMDDEGVRLLIAQRAYDLVKHTYEHVSHIDMDRLTLEEQVATIPDLTEWPKPD